MYLQCNESFKLISCQEIRSNEELQFDMRSCLNFKYMDLQMFLLKLGSE